MNLTKEEKRTVAGMIIEGVLSPPPDMFKMRRRWETEQEFQERLEKIEEWKEELHKAREENLNETIK